MSQNYATKPALEVSRNGQKTAIPLPKIAQAETWWERLLPKWENLIVSGREVKGIVVSPAIAGIVLVFVLGLCSTIYWRLSDQMSSQHDLIIELRTSLKDKMDNDAENRKKTQDEIAVLKVYVDNLREKQIGLENRIKGAKN